MGWAATEFETIDLGDERRNKRAIRLVERLSAQPTASVPQACGDWADTIAAYRFFNNEAVDWRAILGAHTDCAMTRMAAHEVVLCIQDTTELDFNGQEASGLGPLELFFLSLLSADVAVQRVAERVRQGGHDIPEATIRRRFEAGKRLFFERYQPLVDQWIFYDNSGDEPALMDWSGKP